MDDSQIHGSIEQLVAEEHELWGRERPDTRPRPTANGCNSSRFRSTNAGIYCASAARYGSWGGTRTMQMSETSGGCRALSSNSEAN